MSFKTNLILKAFLPQAIGSFISLPYREDDKLTYQGFQVENLPRFSIDGNKADSNYSVGYGTELTYRGCCFGYYDNDRNFHQTNNPISERFYIFDAVKLLDNETYKPYKKEEEPELRLYSPLDEPENIFQQELTLPSDAELRETLDYPDSNFIAFGEAVEQMSIAAANKNRTHPIDKSQVDSHSDTYEDEKGTFKTSNTRIYIAESILTDRIHRDYYWCVERKDDLIFAGHRLSMHRNAA